MAFQQILLNYFFLLALFFLPIGYLLLTYHYSFWKRNGIPGPPNIPFLGSMFSFKKPIPLLQKELTEKYGKFYGTFQGFRSMLVISDPAIIKRILVKDFPLFRNRVGLTSRGKIQAQNLVSVRDERWKRIRSILSPLFTTSKLKKMENLIGQCIGLLVKKLDSLAEKNDKFLAHNVMGNFTMDVIAKCAFGTDTDAHSSIENPFVSNARELFRFDYRKAITMLVLPSFLQKLLYRLKVPFFWAKRDDFFLQTSYHLINQRKKQPNNNQYQDMLQLMINAEHGVSKTFETEDIIDSHHVNVGKEEHEVEEKLFKEIIGSKYLSEDEIVAQSVVFFLAGYETTASTLSFCIHQLAVNPDIQEKLYQEVKTLVDNGEKLNYNNVMKLPYLDAVISETLRCYPPALALSREASEDYHIPEYNYTIKKGQAISIPIYSIHYNPEYYKNPDKFDPERFMPENRHSIVPYTYLPFGGGPRNCIGMRFALSEIKLGLSQIINKFQICKINQNDQYKLKIENSLFILKTEPIYVSVKRRS